MLSEVLTVEQTALAGFSVFEFRGRNLVDGSSLNRPPPEILFLLEPNESIEDQRLVALPADLKPALRIEFSVASAGNYTWKAATIVQVTGNQLR